MTGPDAAILARQAANAAALGRRAPAGSAERAALEALAKRLFLARRETLAAQPRPSLARRIAAMGFPGGDVPWME